MEKKTQVKTLSSLSFEMHTLWQSTTWACRIKRYLDNVVGMFRKTPKIAWSLQARVQQVPSLKQAGTQLVPSRVLGMLWAALSSGELPESLGRKLSPWGTPRTSSKWRLFPSPGTRAPQDWTGGVGPMWALPHLSVPKEQGRQGAQLSPLCATATTSAAVASGDLTPPRGTAFSHSWPDCRDVTAMALYSNLSKRSDTCKIIKLGGEKKKLYKIKQILIKRGCCPAC